MPTFLACVLGLLALVAVAVGGAVLLPDWLAGTAAFGFALASGFGLAIAGFAAWLLVLLVGVAVRASLGVAGVMLMFAGFLVGAALRPARPAADRRPAQPAPAPANPFARPASR